MNRLLTDEEIERLAKKYQQIKNSQCNCLKNKYSTFENFIARFLSDEAEYFLNYYPE